MKKVIPFSNATEATTWMFHNCDKCKMPSCWSKRSLELGFISGDISIVQAKKIGGEMSGKDFFSLNNKCQMFTDTRPKKKKLPSNEIYPTLF